MATVELFYLQVRTPAPNPITYITRPMLYPNPQPVTCNPTVTAQAAQDILEAKFPCTDQDNITRPIGLTPTPNP